MSDEEDTLHLADIPDRPAAVPSQSSRTSNLPWVNNKIILGSKPSPDPSKRPPKKSVNIGNDTPQESDVSEVCKHCKVRFADRDALEAHIIKEIAVIKTPKRNIEQAKDGKECQLTKKSEVGKVGKRWQEESISEARHRENEASTSNIDSIHQRSSTKSLAHENMKKLKIARELQVEANKNIPKTRDHGESTKPVSIRPEIKESLSLQNKPSSSWEPDIVNQNDVQAANKKPTSSKRALKNKPAKVMKKVRFSICGGSKTHAPRNTVPKQKTSTERICTTCKKKFTYKKSFQSHVLQCTYKVHPRNFCTQNVLYQCPPCNRHYRTHQGLKKHVQRGHSDCDRILKCDACNIYLVSRAYYHHMNIQHKVMEYELKDLCIKHVCGQSLHNKDKPTKDTSNGSATRPAKSTKLYMQHEKDQNQSLSKGKSPSNKTTTNYCISKPDEIIEKAKDNIISTPNETNEESSEAPDISPNIIYKCQKCNVHFVTKTALKNHHSQQNCPDIETSDEVGKCLICQLVFYTECIIEHMYQHIRNNSKTSNDFVIICNETIENQCHDTPTKQTQTTKRLSNPDEAEVPLSKRLTFETDVDCYRKNDQTVSVKSLAEAWIYKKYHERLNVAGVNLDSCSILLYRCHKCSLNFLNDDEVKMHLSTCNGESGKWHQCPMCSYSFSESSLDLHVYIHHARMELKRENFEIISSESLHCPTTPKSPQSLNNQDQMGDNALKNNISKNNSDVTQMSVEEVEPGECVDSIDETKDMILASNKSSREKIAYAIESIDNRNEEKPLVKINEAKSILDKEELNVNVFTKKNEHLDKSSSLLKQSILNDVSPTLTVNPSNKPNDQNTDNEKKVLTDKLTEDIVSIVTSIDSPKQSKKKKHLFKCHICPIHFMTKKTLESHIFNDNHHENGKKCNYCNLIFHKYTIKKHITNHHEKFHKSVNFPFVISEYFKENQKGTVDLTLKQKSNTKKLPNISIQTNFTGRNVERASSPTKDPVELAMSNDHKNSTKQNYVYDLAENLNNNISEIIDLSNSQDLENDHIPDPVTRCNKDSPNPRNSEVSHYSNNHNKNKLTKITKRRTKSQDQREFSGQREITINYSRSSKTVTNNVNTGTNYKNEGGITTVENNVNEKSEFSALSHLIRKNNIEIVPIHPKASPDIETKTQQKSVNHAPTKHAKRGTGLDGVEKIQDKYLKPSYSHKSSNESQSPITTGTSSNQKSHRGLSTRIAYEDSSCEIIATYKNNEGLHKIPEEKKSQRKSLDNPSTRERHECLNAQNQQTISTVSTSNSSPRTDSSDIIIITNETIGSTAMDGTRNNSSKHNMNTALGIQNRRKSVVTTGSVMPNTSVAPPQPTTNNNILPKNVSEQNMSIAFDVQNTRKSLAMNGSGIPKTPVASRQPATNNNTETQRKNKTVQNGILPKKISEQNMSIAFDVQNTRKSVATNGSGIPKTAVASRQPATINSTETSRNNNIIVPNMSSVFDVQNRRKSVGSVGNHNTTVAHPQRTSNHNTIGRLPYYNAFDQNIYPAFGEQNSRQSLATTSSGTPNSSVGPSQPANVNFDFFSTALLHKLALLQPLPFQRPGYLSVQNQPKTHPKQNKKRQPKTQKVPDFEL